MMILQEQPGVNAGNGGLEDSAGTCLTGFCHAFQLLSYIYGPKLEEKFSETSK